MKLLESVQDGEANLASSFEQQLKTLPNIEIQFIKLLPDVKSYRPDLMCRLRIAGIQCLVIVESKSNGAPRFVRDAVFQLESYLLRAKQQSRSKKNEHAPLPMVFAPYLSPQAREICREHDVAYLDCIGNIHIAFKGVYVDREVADVPRSEVRSFRSIFSPKAALVLRRLLSDPERVWPVKGLAQESGVSLGHVSNVRRALVEREWAFASRKGLTLIEPGLLLQNWRENYRRPIGPVERGYTHLHDAQLDERLQEVMGSVSVGTNITYSLNSAAQWTTPYVRGNATTLYVNERGAMQLEHALRLKPALKGANVVYRILRDETLFDDLIEPTPDVFCTNPIVTCLDLWSGNDRNQEAANHLAQKCFTWFHQEA